MSCHLMPVTVPGSGLLPKSMSVIVSPRVMNVTVCVPSIGNVTSQLGLTTCRTVYVPGAA